MGGGEEEEKLKWKLKGTDKSDIPASCKETSEKHNNRGSHNMFAHPHPPRQKKNTVRGPTTKKKSTRGG